MNASVYLFGEFNSGYTQYPDDYTSEIFNIFHKNAKSTTQIAIHRDGNLMYYGYIRKLEQNHYIGMCVVLNGLMLTRIDRLFSLFENSISWLVSNGQLIHFNEQGNIVTEVEKLYMNQEDVDLLTESLQAGLGHFAKNMTTLPAVNFSLSNDSVRNFAVDDDLKEIIESSHTYGYTFIYKSKSFNTAQMNNYKSVLARANKERIDLQDKLDKLQVEHAKTLRQKKQFLFVGILMVMLLGCAIGMFSLNTNLHDTRGALSNAHKTIREKNDSLSESHSIQLELGKSLQNEKTRRIKAENKLDSIRKEIGYNRPFLVKNTSFNFETGYLDFDYYGLTDNTVKISVRAYNDSGDAVYKNIEVYIESGNHSKSVYVSSYLNSDKWYSFEILKGDVILGGDRH